MTMGEKTIAAGEFKARCLALLDDVERTGTPVIVTKRGRPVARIVPTEKRKARSLRGSIVRMGDVVSSTGERWGAEE
jgi:prevent-host-death family protein